MKRKNKITILSTFTDDKLVDRNAIIERQSGGPAFYLSKALEKEGVPFALRTGKKMDVQILITEDGEFGKITKKIISKKVLFSRIKTPFLMISSVLDEFDLSGLPAFKGKVFLDVQGYVRNGQDFGKKKLWQLSKTVFANIYCLKGTREELQYIPTSYFKQQKQKLLVVTNGKRGGEIFAFGKRFIIKPEKVVESENTIGAGDTFFAYFVSFFSKTENAVDSAKHAVKRTSSFLSCKNIHHNNQSLREETGCS